MRVVVTRPAHSGERTAGRLAGLGHEAVLLPLTHPVHDGKAAGDALAGSRGALAVTSAEAIRTVGDLGPALAPQLSRPLFAVGTATAEAAEAAGFTDVLCSQGSGAELAELILAHRPLLADSPLLYLAGSPRAASFEAGLAELAIPFRTVECYAMADARPDDTTLRRIFLEDSADAVLLYSRLTAERFFSLPALVDHPEALARIRLLCLSAAVAEAIPDRLRANVEIAAAPDEDSLLALLGAH